MNKKCAICNRNYERAKDEKPSAYRKRRTCSPACEGIADDLMGSTSHNNRGREVPISLHQAERIMNSPPAHVMRQMAMLPPDERRKAIQGWLR